MKVLVIQHHPKEGPGVLGDWLQAKGCELDTRHVYQGDPLPASHEGIDIIVSMGGPMNVYEEEEHAWLRPENQLLAKAAQAGVPIMGICLGAQLLAKALGAEVVRSPSEEIGWFPVELTDAGKADPLFRGVKKSFSVLQWHGDMFNIPPGAANLATAPGCPHQALGYKRAYGLQFHVEVTKEILEGWYETEAQRREIPPGFATQGREMAAMGEIIFQNFWDMAQK